MKKSLLLLHFLPFSVLGRPLPTVQEATEQGSTSISPTNINNNIIIDSTIINGNDQYHHQQQQPLSPSSPPPPPPPHPSGTSPKTTTITTTKPPPSPPSLSNEEEEKEKEEESSWKWNLSDGTTPPESLVSGTTATPELVDSESEPSEPEPDSDPDSESELGTGAAVPIPSASSTKDSIINDNNVTTNIKDNEIHNPELGEQTQTQNDKGHGKFLPPHNNTTITNDPNHPTPSSTPSGSQNPDPDSPPTKKESSPIPVRKTYFRHLQQQHADTEVSTPVKRSKALLSAHADRIAVVGVLVLVPVSVLVI
ncbi:hypothetical protein N8T08_004785 [Aspergillus melleus]|uniref:Uncharacterized protein n=1 Tax=Aspergillus melleus TaxID=138277 RepID=A0ACC3B3M1_9EURO|nr:hypothetical protein N8T08_004785 [Aspergillus melleus]